MEKAQKRYLTLAQMPAKERDEIMRMNAGICYQPTDNKKLLPEDSRADEKDWFVFRK